jgi:hypothetical protein
MVDRKDSALCTSAPILSDQTRPLMDRTAALDLRKKCPVCGVPYQHGDGVLALACISFATGTVPSIRAARSSEHSSQTILGHSRCVLPRILTLLAGFQPEGRFVTAFKDFSTDEPVFPEHYHDEP